MPSFQVMVTLLIEGRQKDSPPSDRYRRWRQEQSRSEALLLSLTLLLPSLLLLFSFLNDSIQREQ